MNLAQLAFLILDLNQAPISRIRFTKTIYFIHKELIRKGIMQAEDIAYLRLPLGPVPEGFMALALQSPAIVVRKIVAAHLSYEAEEYGLKPNSPNFVSSDEIKNSDFAKKTILRVLELLASHSTPELVEASHDPSWLSESNGAKYYLTPLDLKNTFPLPQIRLKIKFRGSLKGILGTPANEFGQLQANLIRGMLTDIVKESTDLEYPDEETSSSKDKKQPETPIQPNNQSVSPDQTHE